MWPRLDLRRDLAHPPARAGEEPLREALDRLGAAASSCRTLPGGGRAGAVSGGWPAGGTGARAASRYRADDGVPSIEPGGSGLAKIRAGVERQYGCGRVLPSPAPRDYTRARPQAESGNGPDEFRARNLGRESGLEGRPAFLSRGGPGLGRAAQGQALRADQRIRSSRTSPRYGRRSGSRPCAPRCRPTRAPRSTSARTGASSPSASRRLGLEVTAVESNPENAGFLRRIAELSDIRGHGRGALDLRSGAGRVRPRPGPEHLPPFPAEARDLREADGVPVQAAVQDDDLSGPFDRRPEDEGRAFARIPPEEMCDIICMKTGLSNWEMIDIFNKRKVFRIY